MPLRKIRAILVFFACASGALRSQTPEQIELFEKNARPLFADKCQALPQRAN